MICYSYGLGVVIGIFISITSIFDKINVVIVYVRASQNIFVISKCSELIVLQDFCLRENMLKYKIIKSMLE